MLIASNGEVMIRGNRLELHCELAHLMRLMVEKEVITRQDLLDLVDLSCKTSEQLENEANDIRKSLLNTLAKAFELNEKEEEE